MQLSELEWAPGWEFHEEDSVHFWHAHGLHKQIVIVEEGGGRIEVFATGCCGTLVSGLQAAILAAMTPGEVYAWAQERAGG